jgi:hypothetical protein
MRMTMKIRNNGTIEPTVGNALFFLGIGAGFAIYHVMRGGKLEDLTRALQSANAERSQPAKDTGGERQTQ